MPSDVEQSGPSKSKQRDRHGGIISKMIADAVRPAVNETLDRAETAAGRVVDRAGRETRRTIADALRRSARILTQWGRESRDVVADIDQRLARQQEALDETIRERVEDWHEGHRRLLDDLMDRAIAVGMALVLLYGAYFCHHASHEGPTDFVSVGVLFWMGLGLCTGLVWVAWHLSGRTHRLKPILKWFLYLLGLSGLCVVVLAAMRLVAGIV